MKKTLAFLLAALLSGYVSFSAVAAGDRLGGPQGAAPDNTRWTVLVPELYDDLYVAGTITAIDHGTGMVALATESQGKLNIEFRPIALKSMKVGDVAVVYLGFGVDQRTISAESCDLLAVKVASC